MRYLYIQPQIEVKKALLECVILTESDGIYGDSNNDIYESKENNLFENYSDLPYKNHTKESIWGEDED